MPNRNGVLIVLATIVMAGCTELLEQEGEPSTPGPTTMPPPPAPDGTDQGESVGHLTIELNRRDVDGDCKTDTEFRLYGRNAHTFDAYAFQAEARIEMDGVIAPYGKSLSPGDFHEDPDGEYHWKLWVNNKFYDGRDEYRLEAEADVSKTGDSLRKTFEFIFDPSDEPTNCPTASPSPDPVAPAFNMAKQETTDRLEVQSSAQGADWNRLQVRPSVTLRFGLNAAATSSSPAANGNAYTEITSQPNPMGAGEYLEFCATSAPASDVVVQVRDNPQNQDMGTWTFMTIAACP